ncbi:MAG TPA: D-arabinono-1,4-lactone oxidase [Solirubrobacteraceae bacterium]|jgi:L-gulonolactone oxidase|nr:D-arabinono-1,4-lactone oxidase [Solirubrobacteraceae bacterium]
MSEPSGTQTLAAPARPAKRFSNWTGDQSCAPVAWEHPAGVNELREAVARAADAGLAVRAVGSGHSFSDVACSDGMLVSLEQMGGVLDVDRASGLVRVQGGITIKRLSSELHEHGLALENVGDIDVQTISGAISTATHGTGLRLRNLSAQVHELTLVLADGSLLSCSLQQDAELWRAARVGVGALGVIAEVTLRCVPAFTLHGVDAPAPLEEVLERFDELCERNDHFEFFVFPHARVALTRANNRVERPPRPPGRVSAYLNDVLLTNRAFELFCHAGRRWPRQIPRLNRTVTRLAGRRERTDRSSEIFASPRLVRFTEMEYALPRAATGEAVRRVLELIERERLAVPFPIEVRTVAADDALLSTAQGRDSGFVAVHMYRGMEWERYFRAVECVMDELDGRPHWGKRHFQTAATLRRRYPHWDSFQAVRARVDPHGRFANAFVERVLGPVGGDAG